MNEEDKSAEKLGAWQDTKTLNGWNNSPDQSIYDYLRLGDRVSEELVEYFRDTSFPSTHQSEIVQGSEPYSLIGNDLTGRTEVTYITFFASETPDGPAWFYGGSCFQDSLAPNTADLSAALPQNTRIAAELAQENAIDQATYEVGHSGRDIAHPRAIQNVTENGPLQLVIWRDDMDQPHESILTTFDEARQLTRELDAKGYNVRWHHLDSKDPAAIKFTGKKNPVEPRSHRFDTAASTTTSSPAKDARNAKASSQAQSVAQINRSAPTKTRG